MGKVKIIVDSEAMKHFLEWFRYEADVDRIEDAVTEAFLKVEAAYEKAIPIKD